MPWQLASPVAGALVNPGSHSYGDQYILIGSTHTQFAAMPEISFPVPSSLSSPCAQEGRSHLRAYL